MEKISPSLLIQRIREQIFDWLDITYDFFIYYLFFVILTGFCNISIQSISLSSFPGILLYFFLITFICWFIVHKRKRPFKYEDDILHNPAKISIQTIFLFRLVLYSCLISFIALFFNFISSREVLYKDYSFLHAAFAGELYLLFQYRRVIFLKEEYKLAPVIDVSIAILIFLFFWSNIIIAPSIFLPFIDRGFLIIRVFILYIFSLGKTLPWQVVLVIICTLLGINFSLRIELKKYRKTSLLKLLLYLPLSIIFIICFIGMFAFIQTELLTGNLFTNRYYERYYTYDYQSGTSLLSKEKAFQEVLNINNVYSEFSAEPLRGSSLSDFDMDKTNASTTHCKSKDNCFDISNVCDNNPGTAWLSAKDDGDESPVLTLQLKNKVLMYGIFFHNGFQLNNNIFLMHNRPKLVTVKGYDDFICVFTNTYYFSKNSRTDILELQNKAVISRLEIDVKEQYSGTYDAYCSISEITIMGRFLPQKRFFNREETRQR